MTWLREHLTREGVVTTTDAWIVHELTRAFVTDAATASRTLLLDLDARLATWFRAPYDPAPARARARALGLDDG